MIYFIVFSLSVMFVTMSEWCRKYSNAGKWVFACIAVVVLSFLNWIRDYSIGTDVLYYGNTVFLHAVASSSLPGFFDACRSIGASEPGYVLLNYLVSRFTSSPHVFYLILGLMTNGIAYAAVCQFRRQASVVLSWVTYLLMFYATTLNALRQSPAILLVLLMFAFACQRRYRAAVISLLLAVSFHYSAIVGVVLFVFVVGVDRLFLRAAKDELLLRQALFILVAFALVVFMPQIIELLSKTSLIPAKYIQYLSGSNEGKDLLNSFLVRLPFAVLAVWLLVRGRAKGEGWLLPAWLIIIMEILLIPLQLFSSAAYRVVLYLSAFKIVGYPSMLGKLAIPQAIAAPLYLAFLLFIFWYQVVLSGNGQVYPFVIASDFL